jgi:type IV fimbrial biogenesis protein FimT
MDISNLPGHGQETADPRIASRIMKTRSYGFTLIELMVTLAVVAVVAAIAAPSYRNYLLDSRMSAEINEFLTAVNLARSEAVKRNATVTLCRSSTGTGCASSGSWEQGWIVFADLDGTVGAFGGSDVILRVHGPLTTQSTLVGTTNVASYISFIQDGRSQLADGSAQAGTVDLCVAGASAKGRRLTLALGRASVAQIDC